MRVYLFNGSLVQWFNGSVVSEEMRISGEGGCAMVQKFNRSMVFPLVC
jgi:hypothetical protein